MPWKRFRMGLLPDMQNNGLRMRRECRKRFFPSQRVSGPAMRDVRAVMHAGIAKLRFPLKSVAWKTFLAFLARAQPVILRNWQEAHYIPFVSLIR